MANNDAFIEQDSIVYRNTVIFVTGFNVLADTSFIIGSPTSTGSTLITYNEFIPLGGISGYATSGNLVGTFYPLTGNPSGFLLPSQTGIFINTSETGQFGSSSNLVLTGSTLITLINNLSGFGVGAFATISNLFSTGNNLQIEINTLNSWSGNSTGIFYPRTGNPSGFITSSQTGIFINTSQTGIFVNTSMTGNFINTSETGQFSVANNTVYKTGSQIVSGLKDFSSGLAVSYISGDSNYNIFEGTWGGMIDTIGQLSIDWNHRQLWDNLGNIPLDWINRNLNDDGQNGSIDWQNRLLEDGGGNTSMDWNMRILYDGFIDPCIDYSNRFLIDISGINSLDWNMRTLSGNWHGQNIKFNGSGNFISGLYINGSNLLNLFYPLTGNPSGFIMSSQTGQFQPYYSQVRNVSGNFSIISGNSIILVNTTTSGSTGSLPNVSGFLGIQFIIKDWKGNSSTNNIILTGVNGQTFDGISNYVMNNNYDSVTLIGDGTSNWSLI